MTSTFASVVMESSFPSTHRYTKLNTSFRLQIAMMSGNGFSVETNMSLEDVEKEFSLAIHEQREACFKSTDGSKTTLKIIPQRVEGYMFMPLEKPSELAIPRPRTIQ